MVQNSIIKKNDFLPQLTGHKLLEPFFSLGLHQRNMVVLVLYGSNQSKLFLIPD